MMRYPDGPTDSAKVDSTKYDSKLIGENDLGSAYVHGPFGDVNSNVKIAYLIGMHPLESIVIISTISMSMNWIVKLKGVRKAN